MADFVSMCARGEVEGVREALEKGVDVNSRGEKQETGLLGAAILGHEEVVEVLLAQPGVDVNCRDDMGYTALHWASGSGQWVCQGSSVGMLRRLLAMPGVEVNLRDVLGMTPLMWAMAYGREEAVRVLVEVEGISLDTRDIEGRNLEDGATHRIQNLLEAAREERRREEEERRVRREGAARRDVEVMRRDMDSLLESAPTTGDYTLVCQGEEVACHIRSYCPDGHCSEIFFVEIHGTILYHIQQTHQF